MPTQASNTHTVSSTAPNQTPAAPPLSEKEARIKALKEEYKEALDDYQRIQRNMLHNPKKESFEAYVDSLDLAMQQLWYKIQMCLSDAYDELEAAMAEQD